MENMWDVFFRLLSALIMGAMIGATREKIHRPAGLRTHALICLGAAYISYLSMTVFVSAQGENPGRVAAQIVSGIGFLGAGTILKRGVSIRGLTTAATLWVTAAIGMGFGAGEFFFAFVSTGLVIAIVVLMRPITNLISSKTFQVSVVAEGENNIIENVVEWFKITSIPINSINMEREDEEIHFHIILSHEEREKMREAMVSFMSIKGVKSVDIS